MTNREGLPDYLQGLDPDQLAAATAPLGPVCILAGAGTGKTRTITRRIQYLIDQGFVTPHKVLAVTFTSRAAGEMRDRLAAMGTPGVQALTFHAAAKRQLEYFWPMVAGTMPWRLIDNEKFRLLGQAHRRVGVSSSTETIRDVLNEIDWAKASLIGAEQYQDALKKFGRTPPLDAAKVADCYRAYEDLKATPDGLLLDFNDLLLHIAGAMENSRAVAEEFRSQYRCFVVDEYQDVTPLQQRVLEAWLGDRDNLTVVGDANQTIYSFTGATPKYLMDFSRTYPDATVVKLQRDYRSTPQIVTLANEIISKAEGRIAGSRLELIGQRPPGPDPVFSEYDDETMEARVVARTIKRLIDSGTPASEIAILYRINAQSAPFEQALSDVGVTYQVKGGEGFYQRREIREAVTALIRAAQTRPGLTGANLAQQIQRTFAQLGMTEKEPEGAGARERWQSLRVLFNLCQDLLHIYPGIDWKGLIGQLHTRQQANHLPTVQGVTLASLHAAKGLEWDAVFLVGLTDGMLPISQALTKAEQDPVHGAEAIEEERRLFYVGITRARQHLELSWALARAEGGRKNRRCSRFLEDFQELAGGAVASAPTGAKASRRNKRRCSACGRALTTNAERITGYCQECGPDVNPELLEALKAWRLQTAREKSVAAFMVFSDNTLTAIAERQPLTDVELLQIPGIGEAKLQHYGAAVLQVVSQFQ